MVRAGALLLAALLMASCAPGQTGILLGGLREGTIHGQPRGEAGGASLQVQPQIIEGGYTAQAVVTAHTKASINHLVLKLFKVQNGVPAAESQGSKDIASAQLDNPVTFNGLQYGGTYRIRAYAYKAPTLLDSDLLSTADASSWTDVTLGNTATIAPLKVKLMDVPFSGTATSSGVVVTDGGYAYPAPETIE